MNGPPSQDDASAPDSRQAPGGTSKAASGGASSAASGGASSAASGGASSAASGRAPTSPNPSGSSAGPESPAGPEVATNPTPALAASLVLHLVLLALIAWLVTMAPQGTGEVSDRQIGIAMVHRLPDRDTYQEVTRESEEIREENPEQSASAAAAAAPPADVSPPIDLQGILAAMETTPAPVSGSGIAGDTELDGDAFGDGPGSAANQPLGEQATAKLFGVSGTGSRFVYVLDRSDSMNGFGGRPLRSAKRELVRSLNSLSPQQQFQIIFYNENVKPFQMAGTPMSMVPGEATNLKRAERYIDAIEAFGGTRHKGALLMALRMSPDVIFFLTDAHIPRLSSLELQTIKNRAEQSGTTIHAIEFGSRPGPAADSFLKELATMNGGQYQYVDVRQLTTAAARTEGQEQ